MKAINKTSGKAYRITWVGKDYYKLSTEEGKEITIKKSDFEKEYRVEK